MSTTRLQQYKVSSSTNPREEGDFEKEGLID